MLAAAKELSKQESSKVACFNVSHKLSSKGARLPAHKTVQQVDRGKPIALQYVCIGKAERQWSCQPLTLTKLS